MVVVSASTDLNHHRNHLAQLYQMAFHDIEIQELASGPTGDLTIATVLCATARTCSATGPIFAVNLFELARITGSAALLVCLLDQVRVAGPLVITTTHGGVLNYQQPALGDVTCRLTLPSALVRELSVGMRQRRRVSARVTLDLQNQSGDLVAQVTLTCGARQVGERLAQRLPLVAESFHRMRSFAQALAGQPA